MRRPGKTENHTETQMKIVLTEFIDTHCVALDDGIRLYQEVLPELKEKRAVELDFSGVQAIFSPFLMGFIGKLVDHFEKEFIMERLVFGNITADHLKIINELPILLGLTEIILHLTNFIFFVIPHYHFPKYLILLNAVFIFSCWRD